MSGFGAGFRDFRVSEVGNGLQKLETMLQANFIRPSDCLKPPRAR